MGPRLRASLIVTITVVWAANFIAPIFASTYKPVPEVNIVFMAVLGVLISTDKKPPDPPIRN